MTSSKKKSRKKTEEPHDPLAQEMMDRGMIEEAQPEAPAEVGMEPDYGQGGPGDARTKGEWDAAAQDIEAAIIPPPPRGSCGCGDSLRIEMLDADGQPTGRHRTMGYKLAVAQVSAKRARYARQ